MFTSREKNAAQNHNIEMGNASFENVAKFKYCGTTLTKQNCMHEEIRAV